MINPTVPQYLAFTYLIVSVYTSFIEPMIYEGLGTPRDKLRFWARSLQINGKLIPLLGLLAMLIGLYNYFKVKNDNFLYGSLTFLSTPILMGVIGRISKGNQRAVRIDKKYEPNEELTEQDAKQVQRVINKWRWFHRFRCVIAVSTFVFFSTAANQTLGLPNIGSA